MKIDLLADYRGVLTEEEYFRAGVQEVPEAYALALLAAGRAVAVDPMPEIRVLSDEKADKDISAMSTKELRAAAKDRQLIGWWNMKRETLIERLGEE